MMMQAKKTETVKARDEFTHDGKKMAVEEWAAVVGMNLGTLLGRLNDRGMSLEEALTRPVIKRRMILLDIMGIIRKPSWWARFPGVNRSAGNIIDRKNKGLSDIDAVFMPSCKGKRTLAIVKEAGYTLPPALYQAARDEAERLRQKGKQSQKKPQKPRKDTPTPEEVKPKPKPREGYAPLVQPVETVNRRKYDMEQVIRDGLGIVGKFTWGVEDGVLTVELYDA
jgi:hypothetical protein